MSPTPVARILIVDDDAPNMRALCNTLRDYGYDAEGFTRGEAALGAMGERQYDVLLTDLTMPGMDGVALLTAALKMDSHLIGILMTGQGTIETAVQAMQVGALDYVLKPLKVSTLLPVLERAIATRRLRLENLELRNTVAMHELYEAIALTLDPNALLDKLADAAVSEFGADEASVMLLAEDGESLYVATVRGEGRAALLGTHMPLGQGIAGHVATHREPLVLQGTITDAGLAPMYPRPGIRTALCMPMIARNTLVGVLNLNYMQQTRTISLGQIRGMSVFVNAVAASIEAARLHEEQRRIDARYREVLHMATEAIISVDQEQSIVLFNAGAEQMFGYTADDVLGKPLEILLPSRFTDAHHSHIRAFGAAPDSSRRMGDRREVSGRRKDGSEFPVEASISKRLQGGETVFTAIVRDVTERQRGEQARAQLAAILEATRDIVGTADTDGQLRYLNPAGRRTLGIAPAEDISGATIADFFPGRERARLLSEIIPTILREGIWGGETLFQARDGRELPVLLSALTYRARADSPLLLSAIARDLTEYKKLERQFQQAQKMEAVGRLAGGVAHDFNNLLTVITSYADILLEDLLPEDARREDVQEIQKAAVSAAGLTRQLLAFSRQQVLEPRVLNVNSVLASADKLLKRLLGDDIDLVTTLAPELGAVLADAGQIEQVIVNLAVNARDAMPDGGKITIETTNAEMDEAYARAHPPAQPGSFVMLAVSDTGVGMDEQTLGRIFEPFFTTKEVGKGTGLGLATVYGIAKQSGGFISVYSEPGHGTTFRIYLPRVDEPVEAVTPHPALRKSLQGTETVLLVDDAAPIRAVARRVLDRLGYTVIEAPNGVVALNVATKHHGPIHLLLTDVIMPELGGRPLADQLTALRPELNVLYTSGYTDDAVVRHGVLKPGIAYLQKPFTPEVLARKVREVLDSPRGPDPSHVRAG